MTYGASPSSDISEIANAKFYVTFGHNPAVTRGSGHGKSWQMTCTDLKYSKEFSFGMDMKILLKTFTAFIQKGDV